MTSIFGNVIKKGESFDYNNNNLENTKLYESFMKSIIYQQKYIKPFIDYKKCKEVVRNESKKYNSSGKFQNR